MFLGVLICLRNCCRSLSGRSKEKSEVTLGALGTRAVVGRPVRFSGAESQKDDDWAVSRLRTSFSKAGFDDVTFEYEPIGAAYYYEIAGPRRTNPGCRLRRRHQRLFALTGWSSFRRAKNREIVTDGVALAGDAFDAKIVRHLVSPLLGQAASYQSVDKMLPIPAWIYIKLERWHHLSFLNRKRPWTFSSLSASIHRARSD